MFKHHDEIDIVFWALVSTEICLKNKTKHTYTYSHQIIAYNEKEHM